MSDLLSTAIEEEYKMNEDVREMLRLAAVAAYTTRTSTCCRMGLVRGFQGVPSQPSSRPVDPKPFRRRLVRSICQRQSRHKVESSVRI